MNKMTPKKDYGPSAGKAAILPHMLFMMMVPAAARTNDTLFIVGFCAPFLTGLLSKSYSSQAYQNDGYS